MIEKPPRNGKRALVTGITGQDGSYLAELLIAKGYEVFGMMRRSSTFTTKRIDHLYEDPHGPDVRLYLEHADLSDSSSLNRLLKRICPDEVYNLGAQSHVRVSFEIPESTADITGLGCLRLLEAIRDSLDYCRFYQASSSELFGNGPPPQNEDTPISPRSPYACAKAFAYYTVRNYREAYGMFAVNGILFNHESPRRGRTFVTRKIAEGVAKIYHGSAECIMLGNLDASRDWGYAPDYVAAMWQMLQLDRPDDFVLATGRSHTVREFCELAFARAGIAINWHGMGDSERGYDSKGVARVKVDPYYFRPTEVDHLLGDSRKAIKHFGWERSTDLATLVGVMVDHELAVFPKEVPRWPNVQDDLRESWLRS